MTQSEIEKAAEEYAESMGPGVGDWFDRKRDFLAGAEHARAELEKLTSDLIAQAACAKEQGARRLAEYLVHKTEYPCSSVDNLMQLWREGRGK